MSCSNAFMSDNDGMQFSEGGGVFLLLSFLSIIRRPGGKCSSAKCREELVSYHNIIMLRTRTLPPPHTGFSDRQMESFRVVNPLFSCCNYSPKR